MPAAKATDELRALGGPASLILFSEGLVNRVLDVACLGSRRPARPDRRCQRPSAGA